MVRCCQVMVLWLSDECRALQYVNTPFGAEQQMYCWKMYSFCWAMNAVPARWCYSFADQSRLSARCCTALKCNSFCCLVNIVWWWSGWRCMKRAVSEHMECFHNLFTTPLKSSVSTDAMRPISDGLFSVTDTVSTAEVT
jgi:hypothetical protein